MKRPTVPPTATPNAKGDEVTFEHPAYGVVTIHKINGTQTLFGSDFEHQACVEIKVRAAQHVRRLSSDWYHGREELVAFKLSFAQFANLLSHMNAGDGTPCTIEHVGREYKPYLPPPTASSERFKSEHAETLKDALRELAELDEIASNPKIPAGIRSDLLSKIRQARQELKDNLGFVADQFERHVETNVDKAKFEVDSYVAMAVERVGLDALRSGSSGSPALTVPKNLFIGDDVSLHSADKKERES